MRFAAIQSAFAEALLDPARPVPAGLTSAGGHTDALRFAVYRNNVFVGLTQALAKRFPVTARLVGDAFFTGMARVYAGHERPSSPLMFDYGETFPDFVASFPPARGLPYLADVARVEAGVTRAYHAADVEPIGLAALAGIAPDQLAGARLVPHSSATIIASAHPVGTIWVAHQTATVQPIVTQEPETVLVLRPAMDVGVHVVPARDAAFAEAIFTGAPLGEAAAAAIDADPAFDFGAALVGLVSLGAFGAIQAGDGP